jgi:hypothetical protein
VVGGEKRKRDYTGRNQTEAKWNNAVIPLLLRQSDKSAVTKKQNRTVVSFALEVRLRIVE